MQTLSFYALTDPRNGCVRYVGKTQQRVSDRLHRHIAAAKGGRRSDVNVWIRTLLTEGLRPQVKVLEALECGPAEGSEREKFWIARYIDAGCRLLNMTIGGFGSIGYRHNEKSRRKIREARARQVITDEHRQHIGEGLAKAVAEGRRQVPDNGTFWRGRKRGPMSEEQRSKIGTTMRRVRADRPWSTTPTPVS